MGKKGVDPRSHGAGRKKGTPNRFTQNLMAICKEKNLDVFETLIEIALETHSPDRMKALTELAGYLYPKRSSLKVDVLPEQAAEILRNHLNEKP